MLHTLLATKTARRLTIRMAPFLVAASIAASGRLASQVSDTPGVLDLTPEVPRNEQGYYHGIPGMSGGGGAWRPGPNDTLRYQLPLAAEIIHASPTKDGNFVIEVLLRNADSAPFDLPTSRY